MDGNEDARQLARDFKGYLEFQSRMGNGRVMPAETRQTAAPETQSGTEIQSGTETQSEIAAKSATGSKSAIKTESATDSKSATKAKSAAKSETPQPIVVESDLFAPGGAENLPEIRNDLGDCSRCKLHSTRKTIVFGEGNPDADIVFVGEGPGSDEDEQGRPFVGRAGKLLDKIIEAMKMKREDVYICNVVKCRPPDNRNPETDEVAECEPFLIRQINSVSPRVVVCLGLVAAKALLKIEGSRSLGSLRGVFHKYGNSKLMVTYHPAALLRNPAFKRPLWEDMKTVMAEIRK